MTKRKNMNVIRHTRQEQVIFAVSMFCVLTLTVLCIYPFWNVFANSIATKEEMTRGVYFFPKMPTFDVYREILSDGEIVNAFGVTAASTLIVTVCNVFCSSLFAFLVTQQQLPFRRFIYRYAIITMYVGAGLIPWYIIMRLYGLRNNFWVYIIPNLLGVYHCILIKTYIESLPSALEEAARIDGAGFFTIFLRIILPLCKPILATVALYTAVGRWNSYRDNYLLVQPKNLQTLQMILYSYVNEAEALTKAMQQGIAAGMNVAGMASEAQENLTPMGVRNATTILTMLPIMLVYPFLQKYFAKGIMLGAVKG